MTYLTFYLAQALSRCEGRWYFDVSAHMVPALYTTGKHGDFVAGTLLQEAKIRSSLLTVSGQRANGVY